MDRRERGIYVRVSYVDAESRVHARYDLAVCGGARIQPVFLCVGRRRRACAEMHLCSFAIEKLALGKAAGKSFVKSAIDGPSY